MYTKKIEYNCPLGGGDGLVCFAKKYKKPLAHSDFKSSVTTRQIHSCTEHETSLEPLQVH